jgi:NADPH:quinone reductase-like Zn-dependent oxidoreductase
MAKFSRARREALAGALSLAAGTAAGGSQSMNERVNWRSEPFKAFEVGPQQGLDSLREVTRQLDEVPAGEVLVRVRAAALNHRDLSILNGQYGARKPETRVPGGDGSGEVVAVGPGVSGIAPGDRVTAPHFVQWLDGEYDPAIFMADLGSSRDGWFAEFILLPAPALVKLPDGMSFEDAAALGAAGITAWTVLRTLGQIKPGDTVLTLGTGGVSMLALQIAGMAGARVAITSSSDSKLAIARDVGADITVNYRNDPDWPATVRAATGGRGVDIVVETVGLATLTQSLSCCAPNARIGLLGALGGRPEKGVELGGLILGNTVLKGITSGSRQMLQDLLTAFAVNGVRPRIDRVFPFADTPAAYDYLARAGHIGKVVVAG